MLHTARCRDAYRIAQTGAFLEFLFTFNRICISMTAMDARAHNDAAGLQEAAAFLQKHPAMLKLLCDPQTRDFIDTLGDQGVARIAFLAENPWLDLERVVSIADSIVNISPEISQE